MENIREINYLEIVRRDFKKVLAAVLIVVLVSLIATLLQPFMYRASVSVLVLQKSSFSIDAYSAAKSEERTANKLSQVVYSSVFLKRVLQSGFQIDGSYFPQDELKKRKLWGKTIEANVPAGYSRLDLAVYHPDPDQALQIAQAVAYVLTNEKNDYIGISDIDLKLLDTPLATKYPVRPNVLVNLALAIVIGLVIGCAFVIITYRPERDKLLKISKAEDHLSKKHETIKYHNLPVASQATAPMRVPKVDAIPDVPRERTSVPPMPPKPKQPDLPKFDEEGEIIGMPE